MWLLIIVASLALLVVAVIWARRARRARLGPRGKVLGGVGGTLLVTGVSGADPGPDAPREHFVTITGVINGPGVHGYVVYQRMLFEGGQWPAIGQHIEVEYSPKNPDNWAPVEPGMRPAPPDYIRPE